jgi:2'-5' RNA ligase
MLLALDVAILPPPEVSRRAIQLSASLPESESLGLRLGPEFPPHITLTQQFVPAGDLDSVLDRVASILAGMEPMRLTVTGGGRGQGAVWMAIERTPPLSELHRKLMDVLSPFERTDGTAAAFVNGDGRSTDVEWVARFRQTSSYTDFLPHITLGHSATPPPAEPLSFRATTIAACHLGKFCTCRRVLRQWTL